MSEYTTNLTLPTIYSSLDPFMMLIWWQDLVCACRDFSIVASDQTIWLVTSNHSAGNLKIIMMRMRRRKRRMVMMMLRLMLVLILQFLHKAWWVDPSQGRQQSRAVLSQPSTFSSSSSSSSPSSTLPSSPMSPFSSSYSPSTSQCHFANSDYPKYHHHHHHQHCKNTTRPQNI